MSKVGKIQADVINETYININLAIKEAYKSLVIYRERICMRIHITAYMHTYTYTSIKALRRTKAFNYL
jgi:hypothetical protein